MFGTRYYCAATRGIGGRRLRAALLASSALALAWTLPATPSRAQDATWLANPGSGDFYDANNWSPNSVPTGTATFGTSATTTLTLGTAGSIGGWTFDAGASAYTFDVTASQTFTGAGIVINGGSAAITNNSLLRFYNTSTAGNAALINNAGGTVDFTYTAGPNGDGRLSAGSIAGAGNYILGANELTVGGNNLSTEVSGVISGSGSLVKTGSGTLTLSGANTYTGGTTINGGTLQLGNAGGIGVILGAVTVDGAGTFDVVNADMGGITTISNAGRTYFSNSTSAGNATITNNGDLEFFDTSTAGSASIANYSGLYFLGNSTAGSATITSNGTLNFFDTGTAGSATIANDSGLSFNNASSAGSATITNNSGLYFYSSSTAGNATITNNGFLTFFDTSTAGNAALVNNTGGAVSFAFSTGPNGDGKLSAGSIAGAGSYILGANELTVGGNNLSTEVSGVISGTGGSLVKTGTGTLTLSGANTYTGGTTINGGTLQLGADGAAGSILGAVTVGSGGTLEIVNADTSGITTLTNSDSTYFRNGTSAASATITNSGNMYFNEASMAASATITNSGTLQFNHTSTAGSATITNNGGLTFFAASTAGSAAITNDSGAALYFYNASTAGSASITNNNDLRFFDTSTAGNATITNNVGNLYFYNDSTAGSAAITNDSSVLYFYDASTAGSATITNNVGSTLHFNNTSTAGSANITNNSDLYFYGTSTADNAAITNNYNLRFYNASTAGSATIINNSGIGFYDTSSAGNAAITINGTLSFNNASSAGSATITNSGSLGFGGTATAGSAAIINNNNLVFFGTSTAGSATVTNNSLLSFFDSSTGGAARLINGAGGTIDLSVLSAAGTAAGSIEGAGTIALGSKDLQVGGNDLSTTFSGVLQDGGSFGGTGGALTKTGTGTLTLSGTNTYTGATTVDGGLLAVNGSIASSSGVTVNSGGALGGTGTVGNIAIMSGGALAPGNSIGTLTVNGNLTFNVGGFYTVEVSPTAADRTNVTGTATLTGATVQAIALPGSFRAQTYTILNATGGFGGTEFAGVTGSSFRPGARNPHLTYDANNVYLVLDPGEIILPSGTNANQASVAGGINRAVLGGATPPAAFDVLLNLDGTPLKNALTQISGETATGAQQSTFNAMTMFMGQMTDPFIDGRGDMGASIQGISSYAANGAERRAAVARDAFAAIPPAVPTNFEQRWNVWAAGFGGSQTSSGNTAFGSNGATSRLFGTAAGADYWFSAHTLAGFALAGGGTNFSVAGGGTGRSDLFQAGAFLRHYYGPAYFSAALAYGWQDVTTDRTVTIAGIDRLQARFQANTFAGRVEGGYRFATPWMAVTPYAAGQVTTFQLPAYAESVLSGANTFALSYGAKTVTASRSELGLRTDRSWAVNDAILTLRGRAAWAHDFNPDRAAAATFQTLPGASFVVNGAAQARDAALTTAAAEMKWRNGFSLGATFEGEFSNVTRSYAGKGVVRYVW